MSPTMNSPDLEVPQRPAGPRSPHLSERHPGGSSGVFLEPAPAVESYNCGLRVQADVGDFLSRQRVHQPLDHSPTDAAALPLGRYDDVPYGGVEYAV